ncbi:MAG TPA: hypothetical protein VF221_17855 [Chloroflexota bacterium]
MNATRVDELAQAVADGAEQLERGIERAEPRKVVFETIRTVRRALDNLEGELRDGADPVVGDAC